MPRVKSTTKPTPFTIIVDTREQAPFSFTGIPVPSAPEKTWDVKTLRVGLDAGDYSIRGWEHLLTVERKSLQDLYGTIGAGHERFEAEHRKMKAIIDRGGFAAVVVEADANAAINFPPPTTTLTREHLLGNWSHFTVCYGVPWCFMPGRREAELFTFRLMMTFWKNQQRSLEELL